MVWRADAPGGVGGLVLLQTPTGVYHPLYDFRGNIVALFDDATGALAEYYTYDAFGRTKIFAPDGTDLAQSAVGNIFFFCTKFFDSDLGLYARPQ
ncbi:MAG: hypothetical protein GXP31_10185 [Kiritimatiellaeota bacterium]|nr:hypothetical protein [Kiritimatiellota bacterium]